MKYSRFVEELSNENEVLRGVFDKIKARFIKTDKGIVESLTKIAFILYIKKDFKNAMSIVDKLSGIEFNNDYDYWTWIEYAIALRAEISIINNDDEKNKDSIKKIIDALNSGEGLPKKIKINVHNRFMAGESVELDNSNFSSKNTNFYDNFSHRLIYQMALVKLKVLGASKEYPIGKVTSNIESNSQEMQKMIDEGVLLGIQPFK